mmetsp:Transcript_1256/g.4233  ORF Transcript_1256/g.4233 Transcript_1256/m.4233 type:complete len:340 (+) Transcript_1256:1226-2245(+)
MSKQQERCADAGELAVKAARLLETGSSSSSSAVPSSWREPSERDELGVSLTIWRAAAGSISKNATKLGLVYADGTPTAEEASSICEETLALCAQLATARVVVVQTTTGAGGPLRELVDASTRQILTAVESLGRALHGKKSKGLAEAGIVWQVCEDAAKVPKSNRAAYRRKFMTFAAELKDSIDEFNHTLAAAAGDDDDDDAQPGFDDDDDDLTVGASSYAPDEAPAAKRCLALLEAVGLAYRAALLALDDLGTHARFEAIAVLYTRVGALAKAATATAEELYPPLDKADLLSAVDVLSAAFAVLAATTDLASKGNTDVPKVFNLRVASTLGALNDLIDR